MVEGRDALEECRFGLRVELVKRDGSDGYEVVGREGKA